VIVWYAVSLPGQGVLQRSDFYFVFFLVVPRFELRALSLPGRPTVWVTPPVQFVLVILGIGSRLLPRLPPYPAIGWDGGLLNFFAQAGLEPWSSWSQPLKNDGCAPLCPGISWNVILWTPCLGKPQTSILSISASWVPRITGVSHGQLQRFILNSSGLWESYFLPRSARSRLAQ
jgi:hypothetical protein